jgi:hypothetical protein
MLKHLKRNYRIKTFILEWKMLAIVIEIYFAAHMVMP